MIVLLRGSTVRVQREPSDDVITSPEKSRPDATGTKGSRADRAGRFDPVLQPIYGERERHGLCASAGVRPDALDLRNERAQVVGSSALPGRGTMMPIAEARCMIALPPIDRRRRRSAASSFGGGE
jgi:hypothetical protein